jgi:hypothetical protein
MDIELWRCDTCRGRECSPPCSKFRSGALCAIESESEAFKQIASISADPPDMNDKASVAIYNHELAMWLSRFIVERYLREVSFGSEMNKATIALVTALKSWAQQASRMTIQMQSLGLLRRAKDSMESSQDVKEIVFQVLNTLRELAKLPEARALLPDFITRSLN